MTKNFVIEVMEVLHAEELEACRLFLESPYFNRGASSAALLQLYDILRATLLKGEMETLDKMDVFQMLYPGKPWVATKLDKLFTELKALMTTFLDVHRHLSSQTEVHQLLALAKEARIRRLNSKYQLSLEKIKKLTQEATWESSEDQFLRYQIALEEHEWHSTYNKSKGDLNIPELIRQLENYFFTQKTELLNRLLLQRRDTLLPQDAQHMIDAPWNIPPEQLGQGVLLDLTWEIYLLLKKDAPNVEDFYRLLTAIQNRENDLKPETLAQFYTYLRNICITFINFGRVELYGVFHAIQKDNLKRGYFYYENKITPISYINITLNALNVGELEWANAFVEEHKDIIIGENETCDFYRMNKAVCLFAEKKFEEALEMIPYGSSYSAYHLMARRLELKIYYELDSDLLPYKIDAFKMFISRASSKALSENLHELFANFINFLRQLSLTPKIYDKSRSARLIKRINEKKLVAERSWLLEKAEEFGRKRR